ncbi:hypothetical protein H696_00675 [Fonticula alba]|uniref:Amidase domain-containing protein n=1 Tax=Fonticula alba TaxID=691883 RepID=A0A058ZHY3_FONAL|nr:hypothetical protein H696_00675 [Fonticula alba]KCV73127.1 hypothetical protein H696_00675 [Fonticula alba]|eukprot:XP_009492828.1 hypothetical protein H696_00675 [Fonticula alba]
MSTLARAVGHPLSRSLADTASRPLSRAFATTAATTAATGHGTDEALAAARATVSDHHMEHALGVLTVGDARRFLQSSPTESDGSSKAAAEALSRRLALLLACHERGAQAAALNFSVADRTAQAIRDLLAGSRADGPLAHIPYTLKDNFATSSTTSATSADGSTWLGTTAGSRMLDHYRAPFDATVAERLHRAGATLLEKVALDEFGMGSAGFWAAQGPALHPAHVLSLVDGQYMPATSAALPLKPMRQHFFAPGGSSSGSAVSVSTGAALFSIGTDTGGSVRMPAAFCGLFGFKPSHGRLSRHGLVSYSSGLDCPGILARSIDDVALIYQSLAGRDPSDTLTWQFANAAGGASLLTGPEAWRQRGLRFGVPDEYLTDELSPQAAGALQTAIDILCRAAAATATATGLASAPEPGAILPTVPVADVLPVSLPTTADGLSSYYVLAAAGASSDLARFDGIRFGSSVPGSGIPVDNRSAYLGRNVRARIMAGVDCLSSSNYEKTFSAASRIREAISQEFAAVLCPSSVSPAAFADFAPEADHLVHAAPAGMADVLLVPTVLGAPPRMMYIHQSERDSSLMPSQHLPGVGSVCMGPDEGTPAEDAFTVPASLAGLPACTVPIGTARFPVDRHHPEGMTVDLPVGVQLIGRRGGEAAVLAAAATLTRAINL